MTVAVIWIKMARGKHLSSIIRAKKLYSQRLLILCFNMEVIPFRFMRKTVNRIGTCETCWELVENVHSLTSIGLDGSFNSDVGHTNKQEARELWEVTCEY